jgi:mRNA-degrading endonuclease HigB of HigAB toxin-antitoxin module
MRITIEKADNAAKKMTEKYREAASELESKVSVIVSAEYDAQLPSEVKDCFKNYPDYFDTTNHVYIVGKGMLKEHVVLTKPMPSKNDGRWNVTISVNDSIADQVVPMIDKAKALMTKASEKKDEIKSVLLSLGTAKNVLEQFPEAIDYIENAPKVRNLPVNLKELRKEFSKEA